VGGLEACGGVWVGGLEGCGGVWVGGLEKCGGVWARQQQAVPIEGADGGLSLMSLRVCRWAVTGTRIARPPPMAPSAQAYTAVARTPPWV